MIKLGLVSAASYGAGGAARASGSNHGTAFATTFNGWDEAKAKECQGTFVRSGKRLEGARVTRIWDPLHEAAERLAAACDIEKVCATAEEACDGVDAVLLIDDGTGEQWRHAAHPLRKGVPVFCDKPLAMTAKAAQETAKLARSTKTKFMSASSLRFVPDMVKLRGELSQIGPVYLASASCGNELLYYGIHALSMVYTVLGGGAVSCLNVGQPGLNIVRARFADHRDVVLIVGEKEWMTAGYQISLYGQKAWRIVKPDLTNLYSYLLEAFLEYLRTGVEPYPIEQEVELIAVLEAGKRSLKEGREVTLKEVLE
ncbi:MAG TPA: Gfo/Idh/MocA family oxidoreductase [Planctomycetota bacterium]|nr:Gfo/Idh/MocA family oxidoreductase [Planctomycetota bacterium]